MLDLAFKLFDQIVNFWNFFVASVAILVGWVFSREIPWPHPQRLTVMLVFVIFVVFNLIGLVKSYKALQVVVNELKKTSDMTHPEITHKALTAMTARFNMKYWPVGIAFHIIVDFIVVYFIYFLSANKPG